MGPTEATSLVDEVRAFLDVAILTTGRAPSATALRGLRERLDQPLRVAIAGRPGSGKSTLLNALLGAEVAPTRGAERAAMPAWYRFGKTPRVVVQQHDDEPLELQTWTDGGLFDVDLPPRQAPTGTPLLVEWPAPLLRELTFIDAPGELPPSRVTADALLYVMPELGTEDVALLEDFHEGDLGHPLVVNAIAVLARVDELGVARRDAFDYGALVARTIAERPGTRRLCQSVVPVAGLLAQAAMTLRADDVDALRRLAAAPADQVDDALGSGERFARTTAAHLPSAAERQWLLLRFGLFGVRVAVALLRSEPTTSDSELAMLLATESGIDELRRTIETQLVSRAAVLKARSAMRDAKAVLLSQPPVGGVWLMAHLERIEAAAHELNELRVLHAIHAGLVDLPADGAVDAERLLGASGADPGSRLGLDESADVETARRSAQQALRRWQRLAVDPVATPLAVHASATVVRTCEGILEGLT